MYNQIHSSRIKYMLNHIINKGFYESHCSSFTCTCLEYIKTCNIGKNYTLITEINPIYCIYIRILYTNPMYDSK